MSRFWRPSLLLKVSLDYQLQNSNGVSRADFKGLLCGQGQGTRTRKDHVPGCLSFLESELGLAQVDGEVQHTQSSIIRLNGIDLIEIRAS